MKNYHQDGVMIDVVAPQGGLVAGDFYLSGGLFGFVVGSAAENETTVIATEGVFRAPKATGTAWVQGDQLFWDAGAKKFTKTAGDNVSVGIAAYAAASGDASGYVRLAKALPGIGQIVPQTGLDDLTEDGGAIGGAPDGDIDDLAASAEALTENGGAIGGTNDGDLPALAVPTGSTGGTANGAWEDTSGAVTGVDGSSNNAASKTDVDARLAAIANNFAEVHAKLADLIAAVRENAAMVNNLVGDSAALRDGVREVATRANELAAKLRTANIIAD